MRHKTRFEAFLTPQGIPGRFVHGLRHPLYIPRRRRPKTPPKRPWEAPRPSLDTIMVRFGRLFGDMLTPKWYPDAILCRIRSKAQNYYFAVPEGLCTCSNYKRIPRKIEDRSDKKWHSKWSALLWYENRAPDVLKERGNAPGCSKPSHNSTQYGRRMPENVP